MVSRTVLTPVIRNHQPGHTIIIMSVARSAVLGSAMLALAAAQEEAAPLLATALEVVSRASTSSEVLSLNLTNLIILIALKVAIIVFGLVSGGGVTGRSGDAPNALTQSDLTGGMCFLLYTGGDESKLSCIARAACESPSEADNYLSAAKLWYKMSKLIKAVPFNTRYTSIMETVYDAAEHSKNGGECTKYNW